MILHRVIYELFNHEAERLAAHPFPAEFELGRQLRLDLVDGSSLFVAWTWGSIDGVYYVGIAATSYCTGDADTTLDVSGWPLWSPLIGQDVTLAYRDPQTKQILVIRAGESRVHCCSFGRGMWSMDGLWVTKQLPTEVPSWMT